MPYNDASCPHDFDEMRKMYDPDLHERSEGPAIKVLTKMLEREGRIILSNDDPRVIDEIRNYRLPKDIVWNPGKDLYVTDLASFSPGTGTVTLFELETRYEPHFSRLEARSYGTINIPYRKRHNISDHYFIFNGTFDRFCIINMMLIREEGTKPPKRQMSHDHRGNRKEEYFIEVPNDSGATHYQEVLEECRLSPEEIAPQKELFDIDSW